MKYKTELHCHTSEISSCSQETGSEVVEKYIKHGYTTLVITNHFYTWDIKGEKYESPEKAVDAFYDAVDIARDAAGDRLNVLTGMEIRFNVDNNDYLVLGAPREAFYGNPDLFKMHLGVFREHINSCGGVVVQAHPFRFWMRLVHPDLVDGYEICNGHPGQFSHNDLAELWARRFSGYEHMILTSGSDNHYPHQEPNSGILTDKPITSNEELVATLRSGNFELIRPVLDQDPTM